MTDQMVWTTKGNLPRSELEVRDIVTEEGNSRSSAMEWYYRGELVRRDAHVSILSGTVMGSEQGGIGG